MQEYPVHHIRNQFPIFSKKEGEKKAFLYLDSAATTLKPKEVIEKISHFYLYEYGTVHRAVYELAAAATEKYALAREKVRDFIHAKSDEEIVFTRGTTDSINLLAKSFGSLLEAGDEILLSEIEHHSNIVPWQMLAQEKGVVIRTVSVKDNGEFDLEAYRKLLSSKTKLVAVAFVTNTTGTHFPVKEIIKLAHAKKAKVFLDAAQAIAHFKIDVQELDVDFLAFSSHKMYGPTGVGVLYGKKELLEKMPPRDGGGDMIDSVSFEKTTYQKPPLRFEAGTPMIAEVIGLGAAVDFLEKIGMDNIAFHEHFLTRELKKELREIEGVKILGDNDSEGSIVTFVVDGVHTLDLGTILGLKGVCIRTGQLCAEPFMQRFKVFTAARVSFGMYNTYDDVKHFIHFLKEALLLLRPSLASH